MSQLHSKSENRANPQELVTSLIPSTSHPSFAQYSFMPREIPSRFVRQMSFFPLLLLFLSIHGLLTTMVALSP